MYARAFEPQALEGTPSGLADPPRPFVFRAAHLDGMAIAAGEQFHFDVNLFDSQHQLARTFSDVFATIVATGIGGGRGRAELVASACLPLQIELAPAAERITKILVRFLTPTELKDTNALTDRPEFTVLFARARDRVSTLSTLYGPGPLDLDFKGMGERAALVRMTRRELRKIEAYRRSSRTGQQHPLGGFIGEADYEGELAEFVPFLDAAQFTGVGRQTVWGKGQIEVCVNTRD